MCFHFCFPQKKKTLSAFTPRVRPHSGAVSNTRTKTRVKRIRISRFERSVFRISVPLSPGKSSANQNVRFSESKRKTNENQFFLNNNFFYYAESLRGRLAVITVNVVVTVCYAGVDNETTIEYKSNYFGGRRINTDQLCMYRIDVFRAESTTWNTGRLPVSIRAAMVLAAVYNVSINYYV